jgi:tRNA pseudouridine55 synthase
MLGFLNFHKPLGCTSHDCVAQVRRALWTKKVGHGGTLDPAASGVLPMAVGQATRLLPYLPEGKAYEATIRFGLKTTTDDLEGDVLETAGVEGLSLKTIEGVLPEFVGTIPQVPPRYSAIQVQGKRLYKLARAGEAVEVPERRVTIHALRVLNWRTTPYPELDLAVECGSGTYIRSLARDLGDRLGTGATLAALIRTQSSGFHLGESVTIETVQTQGAGVLLTPPQVLTHLTIVSLAPEDLQRWQRGQAISLLSQGELSQAELSQTESLPTESSQGELSQAESSQAEKAVLVCDPGGECLGLGQIYPADPHLLKPKVVFQE